MKAHRFVRGQLAPRIIGQSPAIVRLRAEIGRVAPFSSSVLITGPSGTGKELVARQIHAESPRAPQPFIPVDCASMSGELMASQLFGHVAGAFTGANCQALGCFRAAHRGTLFLDEIGEMEYSLQAKLLRVLQDHSVTPVGSHQCQPVDVRVVAATNRNLGSDVLAGRFREDLYYRLDVVHLRTTALFERREDICTLADAFLRQLAAEGLPACSLTSDAIAAMLKYRWPGNVRQLRNVLEQAAIDSHDTVISADSIRRIISRSFAAEISKDDNGWIENGFIWGSSPPEQLPRLHAGPDQPSVSVDENAAWQTLAAIEREHITRTLAHTYFNRSAAARLLGVTRQSLMRKMKRFGLADR